MNTTTNTRVSEAMVERACEASWPIAKSSCELSDWKQIGSGPRREHHTNVVRAALEAALSAPEPAAQGEVRPKAFGIACTVAWTELHNAMAADGMNPPAASRIEEAAMTAPDVNADVRANADARARFEAKFSKPPFEFSMTRFGAISAWPGNYRDYSVQCAWEGYRAAHAAVAGNVRELVEAATAARRELQACQAVIHLSGGFDPAYVRDAQAAMKRLDPALAKFHPTHQEKP